MNDKDCNFGRCYSCYIKILKAKDKIMYFIESKDTIETYVNSLDREKWILDTKEFEIVKLIYEIYKKFYLEEIENIYYINSVLLGEETLVLEGNLYNVRKEIKELGASWDMEIRKWVVNKYCDIRSLIKYIPGKSNFDIIFYI